MRPNQVSRELVITSQNSYVKSRKRTYTFDARIHNISTTFPWAWLWKSPWVDHHFGSERELRQPDHPKGSLEESVSRPVALLLNSEGAKLVKGPRTPAYMCSAHVFFALRIGVAWLSVLGMAVPWAAIGSRPTCQGIFPVGGRCGWSVWLECLVAVLVSPAGGLLLILARCCPTSSYVLFDDLILLFLTDGLDERKQHTRH